MASSTSDHHIHSLPVPPVCIDVVTLAGKRFKSFFYFCLSAGFTTASCVCVCLFISGWLSETDVGVHWRLVCTVAVCHLKLQSQASKHGSTLSHLLFDHAASDASVICGPQRGNRHAWTALSLRRALPSPAPTLAAPVHPLWDSSDLFGFGVAQQGGGGSSIWTSNTDSFKLSLQ